MFTPAPPRIAGRNRVTLTSGIAHRQGNAGQFSPWGRSHQHRCATRKEIAHRQPRRSAGTAWNADLRECAAECSDAPREVCELALAHVNADRVEAAYRRSDLFERRGRTHGALGRVPGWARGSASEFLILVLALVAEINDAFGTVKDLPVRSVADGTVRPGSPEAGSRYPSHRSRRVPAAKLPIPPS